jgi:hypothetical protein
MLARVLQLIAVGLAATRVLSATEIPANPDKPTPGIECGASWLVENWGNPGQVERLEDKERRVLKLSYSAGEKNLTAYQYKQGFEVPADKILKLWLYSELDAPPQISLAAGVTRNHVWFETKPFTLKKGWNPISVSLEAPNWKSEASGWNFTVGVEPLDDIRYFDLLIYNGKNEGSLLAEGICPDPDQDRFETRLIDDEANWHEGWKRLAALGKGFIVWQSNRGGHWRIWTRRLDGSDERQLSPDEKQHDHCFAHISPDGLNVIYGSLKTISADKNRTDPAVEPLALHIVKIDGTGDRVLTRNARACAGGRCAVWASAEELIYIADNGATHDLNLITGADTRILGGEHAENSWLFNATKTFAMRAPPLQFAHYDQKTQSLASPSPLEGCQGNFFGDGLQVVRVGDTGGPIILTRLDTGENVELIKHPDPRLPRTRNNLAFPVVSRSNRLIAFGASPNQQDFWTSDYDIFVAEIDPKTCEIKDKPVRYTFDKHGDTFPDVFLAPANADH